MFPAHVDLIYLPMHRDISPIHDLRSAWRLRHICNEMRPHLIHLHSSKAGAIGRLAVMGRNIPTVYTPHGFAFVRQDVSKPIRWIYWFAEKLLGSLFSAHILVGSDQEYEQAMNVTFTKRVSLIYNAVKVPIQPPPLHLGLRNVVTVGRLTRAKNPMLVLDILKELRRRNVDINFVWIGDGELRSEFEAAADAQKLAITVTGWLPPSEVYRWLEQAYAYLQPSLWEALPFALLEAMSMGRPVIATAIRPHRDVIQNGYNGYLATEPRQFADILIRLFDRPEEASTIGRRAWLCVRDKYSTSKFVEDITAFYDAHIGNPAHT